jgi:DNA end-binding protein Ku
VARRPYWKGYLKLSLVSCPILLFPASSDREKVSFHQLNRKTGHRIHYRKVDAETGREVDADDIVKGYEVSKGKYVELTPDELKAVALESQHTIEIDKFVPRKEIDELYLSSPYYIVPDGKIGEQAFAVIREAIRQEGMVALGKVVFTSREHIIALGARGNGLLGLTLRYPYEVRPEEEYFRDIKDQKLPKDMLDLARHIVATKKGSFEPDTFEDRYEEALKKLVAAKQKGRPIEPVQKPAPSNVVSLMDALKESLAADGGSGRSRPQSRRARATAGQKGCARRYAS